MGARISLCFGLLLWMARSAFLCHFAGIHSLRWCMGILMTSNATKRNIEARIFCMNSQIMRLSMAGYTLNDCFVLVLMTIYALQPMMFCRDLRKVFACTIMAARAQRRGNISCVRNGQWFVWFVTMLAVLVDIFLCMGFMTLIA
jgi:hypothetical protein